MKKRRKRTNANVPAKGRLRDMADSLWSISVRSDWNWKCAVCGGGPCDAHHLIPRANEATRYLLENGIALCRRCHQFCPDISPHQNAAGWLLWLKGNHELRYLWYMDTVDNGEHLAFRGTKNAPYYCDMILSFREYVQPEKFEEIVGKAFFAHLTCGLNSTDG
jgi:hypothetical protein